MLVIHYPTTYKALDGFVDRFNGAVSTNNQKLKTSTVAAAKEIIRIYGASLLKKKLSSTFEQCHLLPLRTNNKQLATLIKCSSRSVQRHILKLAGAKIIISKVFHGRNADYELCINPEILLIKHTLAVNEASGLLKTQTHTSPQTAAKSTIFYPQKTNCPPPYTGNIKNNNILRPDNNVHFFKNDLASKFKDASENKQQAADSSSRTGNTSSAAAGEILPPPRLPK